jgi:hypothetical protein
VTQPRNAKYSLPTTHVVLQDNLSAKVKIELERKLKALKFHSSEKMIDDVERNNAKKYHMVKHFGKIKKVF